MRNTLCREPAIQFVLNRPRNPKNIGAAARGMANFGFRELAVVAPYSRAWRETRAAVQAGPVVETAKKFKTIREAVRSSHLVIGTSAGSRRKLDETWIPFDDLKSMVRRALKTNQRVSILFGSEKSGLSNEDLGFCQAIVKIPTVPECPSMNLAQAVAVVAFALRNATTGPLPNRRRKDFVTVENKERILHRCLEAFSRANLLKGWDKEATEQRIRKSINRWNVDKTEVAMMHRMFRWILQHTA